MERIEKINVLLERWEENPGEETAWAALEEEVGQLLDEGGTVVVAVKPGALRDPEKTNPDGWVGGFLVGCRKSGLGVVIEINKQRKEGRLVNPNNISFRNGRPWIQIDDTSTERGIMLVGRYRLNDISAIEFQEPRIELTRRV